VRKALKILIPVVIVVIAIIFFAFWYFVLRDDAPPKAALPSRSTVASTSTTTGGSGSSTGTLDGTWTLAAGTEQAPVFAGYRIQEIYGGDTLKRDAVGRSTAVKSSVTIQGTEVTEATITVDTTKLASNQARRDNFIKDQALETNTIPEATFELTEPIELGTLPKAGAKVTVETQGKLTLHAVTQDVTITIEARWNGGDVIDLTGSLPITLADYAISAPDIPGLIKVDDKGTMEFQLVYTKA